MIGIMSLTISPSSVVSSRSTPWVAGWCGPMLSVKTSSWVSTCVPKTGASGSADAPPSPSRSIVAERSRSRYGIVRGSGPSLIPARQSVLVEGEDHGLAADREVAPLRVADVVLRHQDPAQVVVAVEDHAEHVEDLALLEVGGREQVDHRRHVRFVDPEPGAHVQ